VTSEASRHQLRRLVFALSDALAVWVIIVNQQAQLSQSKMAGGMGGICTSKFPMMSEYPLPSFEVSPVLRDLDGIDHAELQINALIENNDSGYL